MLLAESARVIFSLIAVLGSIGLIAVLVRKAGLISASNGFIRKKRLAVVETLAVDARRRVAIIRCDDKEHLIILGPNSETIIDKNLDAPVEEQIETTAQANPFLTLQDLAEKFRPKTKDAA